jgi:hypothetical protein
MGEMPDVGEVTSCVGVALPPDLGGTEVFGLGASERRASATSR